MNRIETALQALQEKEEKAFITYITAGLPDYDKTKAIIKAQEAAGTDIIELGIPFPIRWQTVRSFRQLPMRQFSVGQIWRKHLPV